MAQSFSLRYPLVDGSGNFGSLDGDSAAAMRYTECRLAPISDEMLTEIEQTTVPFRPNYDGTKTEPVVLPARMPNLLVNGTTGIAVGMATNIPPHNLGEVCTALLKLLDNEDIGIAQLCRYIKGPDFPTGGQILNSPEELQADLQDRLRLDPAARHLGHRPGDAVDQDDLHRQRPLHGQQVAAGRADRRGRAEPQAAAAARREGPVDRGRAHRHRDEEGRRREDDHGVPLQAHAAADQLRRQPDVPDPDREPGGRPARAARSQADPLALPALPARGRDQAPRARAGGAQEAHPHPRGLREGLRRARRDHPDHPEVGRQGGRRREDHEALRARRRADRRHPRAEDLPAGAARDPDHPQRARGEAQARAPDRRAAEGRGQPLEAGAQRDRDDPEDLRQSQGRQAPHHDRQRHRRAGIHAGRLHRRGGQRRDRVGRRLGEAAEGSEGRRDDAAARGRLGAGRVRRQHARDVRLLLELRRRLHQPLHRRAGVDRLRRADPAALQAEGRREDRRRAEPRPARDRRHQAAGQDGRTSPPPVARRGRHERRLRAALRPRGVRRAEHARRAALRAAGRRGGGRRRREGDRRGDADRRDGRRPRAPLPGRRGELPVRPGQGRHPDQARRTRTACSGSSPRRAIAIC